MRDVELNCLERIALEKLFLVLELERETARLLFFYQEDISGCKATPFPLHAAVAVDSLPQIAATTCHQGNVLARVTSHDAGHRRCYS
jgi:hypothetical protein